MFFSSYKFSQIVSIRVDFNFTIVFLEYQCNLWDAFCFILTKEIYRTACSSPSRKKLYVCNKDPVDSFSFFSQPGYEIVILLVFREKNVSLFHI